MRLEAVTGKRGAAFKKYHMTVFSVRSGESEIRPIYHNGVRPDLTSI